MKFQEHISNMERKQIGLKANDNQVLTPQQLEKFMFNKTFKETFGEENND